MWGIDLSRFQFDGNLTWAIFFMNADKTIYGRYGSRSAFDAMQDISFEGFKKSAQAALALHTAYPSNRASLAGKTGAKPDWQSAEQFPAFKGMYQQDDISVNGCMHCHYVFDGELKSLWMEGKPIEDRRLWLYPMPDRLGFVMNPNERATIRAVVSGSEAEKAGIRVGDQVLTMGGQPILSTADIQWILHNTAEPTQIQLELERNGTVVEVTLSIPKGFRRRAPFTYSWETTYPLAPGFRSKPLNSDARRQMGLAEDILALEVKQVGRGWGSVRGNRYTFVAGNLRRGDVIVEIDGLTTPMREDDLIAYIWQTKRPGDSVRLKFLRDGEKQSATLRVPTP
jgi:serine protease Do